MVTDRRETVDVRRSEAKAMSHRYLIWRVQAFSTSAQSWTVQASTVTCTATSTSASHDPPCLSLPLCVASGGFVRVLRHSSHRCMVLAQVCGQCNISKDAME